MKQVMLGHLQLAREIKTFVLHLFRIQATLLNGFAHLSPKQGA